MKHRDIETLPNFDNMHDADVIAWASAAQNAYPAVVVAHAVRYAAIMMGAREARRVGDIQTARRKEQICDDIYNGLPAPYRW